MRAELNLIRGRYEQSLQSTSAISQDNQHYQQHPSRTALQIYRYTAAFRIISSPAMDEGQGPHHGVYVGKAKDVTCPGDHEAWQQAVAV